MIYAQVVLHYQMAIIRVDACKCNVCSHIWLPRSEGQLPINCASCKTPRWNVDRKMPRK